MPRDARILIDHNHVLKIIYQIPENLPDIIVPVVRRRAERRPDGGRAVCLGQQLRLRV